MARAKSARYRAQAQALSAEETPLVLLELRHALLAEPLRFVNDSADLVSNGENYVASQFAFQPPDDQDKQTPRAQLRIRNLGADMGAFFERTNGGSGASFRVLQVMRSQPDFIEEELILDVSNVEVSPTIVSGQLSFDDVLNKVGTAYTYRPETAPGLF